MSLARPATGHSSGRIDRALAVLRQAYERHPGDPELTQALVAINRERGNLAAAAFYARKLVEVAPEDPGARQLLQEIEGGNR